MENAVKALLIAAGMFLIILIVSALVVFYNQISDYYTQKHETALIGQTQKFNSRFENFNRKNIRGSDLISLMNRIIDYNATESYFVGTGYERIKVTIELGGNEILKQFKYETENSVEINSYLSSGTITNIDDNDTDWENDKKLVKITNTPSDLCQEAKNYGVNNLTDTKLQKLATGVANIMVSETENSSWDIYNRLKRAELIERILGKVVDINSTNGKTIPGSDSERYITGVKKVTSQYYQYMQFKRAYFDCTEMIFDPETKRIVEMKFQLQTKFINGIETVVFN